MFDGYKYNEANIDKKLNNNLNTIIKNYNHF